MKDYPYGYMIERINAKTYKREVPLKSDGSKDWKAYRELLNKTNLQFKHDLVEAYGVANNPNVEKAYRLAWENGHAFGYGEVVYHFDQLVELLR